MLTFIIPVIHQDAAKNWAEVKKNLADTMRSVAAQKNDNWKGILVANPGADLPELPKNFEVKWVDFPPSKLPDKDKVENEVFYNVLRLDKGRRILAGMLHAGNTGHFMAVDYDDFVSNKLASLVAENPTANGWYIRVGYAWGSGGKLLYKHYDFSNFCGTSHIVRSDLYKLPATFEAASDEYVRKLLGSHRFTRGHFEQAGTPLAELPLVGAVYRIGHNVAASKSSGLISHFFMQRWLIKMPVEWFRRFLCLRFMTKDIRKEFFGEGAGD